MKHIVLTSNNAKSMYNFRAPLIEAFLARGYQVSIIAGVDEYKPYLIKMGCRFIDLPIDPNGYNPIWDLRTLLFYQKILKKLRPTVVMSYTIKCVIYAGFACQWLRIPYFSVITGVGTIFMQENLVTYLVKALYRLSQKSAQKILFLNRDNQNEFMEHQLVPFSKVHVLPGEGVDIAHFYFSELPRTESLTFLYCGRVLADKGVREFYEAAKILKRTYHVTFQILGSVEEAQGSAISKAEIDRWVAEGIVSYLGSAHDVRPYIQQAHCMVLPTHFKEGVPRCLLEAASMGRLMIATRMPGCIDVVKDGLNGFLCEAKSVESLMAQMKRVIELSSEERAKMALYARDDVCQHFRMEHVINHYMNLLSHL